MAPGSNARWPVGRARQRGFTLLELMVVVTLIAIATATATLAFRDGNASKLEEEAARLSALFEGARARARAEGLDLQWRPGREPGSGFTFLGISPAVKMADKFLDERTQAEVVGGAPTLRLGPEPVIGAQRIVLRIEDRQLVMATDGMGPFVVVVPDTP